MKICCNLVHETEFHDGGSVLQYILLIQDDADDAAAVRKGLARARGGASRVVWVRQCSDAIDVLARAAAGNGEPVERIAAIVTDVSRLDGSGIDTVERLLAAAPQIPLVILATESDENLAKLAVRRGAHDYVLKGRLEVEPWPALDRTIKRAVATQALFEDKERAQSTLNSIGDAVVSTDAFVNVIYLNAVAEHLTGWSRKEAQGQPLARVLNIVDAVTRKAVRSPLTAAIQENRIVALTPNCILIHRNGGEHAIEDSSAPIHDRHGRVTGAVMVFRDVTATRAAVLKMSHLAEHDSLTDLPNRFLLNDRLTEALALAMRHQRQVAVLFLDVDRFKHINDSLGHVIGDRLLQSIAGRLLACVRTSDTVSRHSGDEFVILLPEVAQAADATTCAEKMLDAVRAPHRIDDHDLHVTASIGVVTYPQDGLDRETLIRHADFAMYDAKDSGRDNCRSFNLDLNVRARKRQTVENDVRRALEREELALHYQPSVNLRTGQCVGVEALIRWRHPDLGLVAAAEFMSIAEESGLIVPIGRWVLTEACHQARAWQEIGLVPIPISVNVSGVELRTKKFLDGVRAALEDTGLAAQFLELDLTETFLIHDSAATSAVLKGLKHLGIRLALDNFGTGFSSLSHLRRLPIDTLKIDGSFVQGLAANADDASIVRAIVGMGEQLHVRVVAEGVETLEQFEFLKDSRCPFGQGHYFGLPLPGPDCTDLLRRRITANTPAGQAC